MTSPEMLFAVERVPGGAHALLDVLRLVQARDHDRDERSSALPERAYAWPPACSSDRSVGAVLDEIHYPKGEEIQGCCCVWPLRSVANALLENAVISRLSIDVVIPTYNGWDHTASCLEHLQRQTRPHEVIIADNGSTDGTPARVRAQFPAVRLVELGGNRGFAKACNRGVDAGRGDVVVLLNNDVDCPPDFLDRLIEPLESDELLGSVAAVLVQRDGNTIDSVGIAADVTLAGYPRLRGRPLSDALSKRPVLAGPFGAAGAYRRVAWEEVGGLDEGVFMYGEDTEFALRLRAAGWSTTLAADAVATHFGSATAGHQSGWQRLQSGFGRGYFVRRYGVLQSRAAVRTFATEALVVVGDARHFQGSVRTPRKSRRLALGEGTAATGAPATGIDRQRDLVRRKSQDAPKDLWGLTSARLPRPQYDRSIKASIVCAGAGYLYSAIPCGANSRASSPTRPLAERLVSLGRHPAEWFDRCGSKTIRAASLPSASAMIGLPAARYS